MSFNIHVQVPLGLLFKNENKTDEMIDILTELHDNYLPVVQHENTTTIPERCYFGGDQLTDERARNAVLARSDGDDMHEQLKGFIPKVEDWHCGRLTYQVSTGTFTGGGGKGGNLPWAPDSKGAPK